KWIFEETFQFTPSQLMSNQCSNCFGTCEGKQNFPENKPHMIVAMDENLQPQYQAPLSKDNPTNNQYP
ncbi:hypothetical protein CROQUDRAFT_43011, partial [Cronartium quercuum f. sp. fusiforme G11]